jgi:hypothetical protein
LRYLLILSLLLSQLGCRSEESLWDELNEDERNFLRDKERLNCEAESEQNFQDLAQGSTNNLLNLQRGDYWKVTVSDSTSPRNLRVWSVDTENVYFLYFDPTSRSNFFIKVTALVNSEMFEDFQKKKCNKKSGYTIEASSSSVNLLRKDVATTEDSTRFLTDFTFSTSSSLPAFFSYFNVAETKKKLDSSGNVASDEKLINKIEYVGNETSTDVLKVNFNEYSPRRFCIIKYSGSPGEVGVKKLYSGPTYPFTSNLNCTPDGADGSDPNATGADPSMSFTSDELIY